MGVYGRILFMGLLAFFGIQLPFVMAANQSSADTSGNINNQHFLVRDCPLDLSSLNFTLLASLCSNNAERAICCRHMNAFTAISVARYANATGNLGVPTDLSDACVRSILQSMELYGVPRNATVFCGFGTKILVNYDCRGRTTVVQMIESPKFADVTENCKVPLIQETDCKKCLNAGIVYLHRLVGAKNNVTLGICRDASFSALASRVDDASAAEIASCFFHVQGFNNPPVSDSSPPALGPEAARSPLIASSPNQLDLRVPLKQKHHSYHMTSIEVVGIAITLVAVSTMVFLTVLIRRKSREIEDPDSMDKNPPKKFPSPRPMRKFQEGAPSMFRKYSYKETKKATENFSTVIGRGGFGTVYKAEFSDGSVVAVKGMDNISAQAEDEFCREIELLARLHHRHLVALKGFCINKHDRFLMYEYMANGSLKDHLHSPGRTPLSWETRIQIAIDVANALEYLHFYCDPPLCHKDIKSSNILLEENFVAKVADFGLAHASKDGSICFKPVNTDIRGTPGYMDPEYVIAQELTEKSDIYSYGVVLLEMVTGKCAVDDGKNLLESSQMLMASDATELVDHKIKESFDMDQLETVMTVIRWCTQKEGRSRPSVKQILRLLYETSDPMQSGFIQAVEDEEYEGEEWRGGTSRGKSCRSGDVRYLPSSSSTSRSYCSTSFLPENGSPQSPYLLSPRR